MIYKGEIHTNNNLPYGVGKYFIAETGELRFFGTFLNEMKHGVGKCLHRKSNC